MSNIARIKEMAKEGKGLNAKAVEYLIWYQTSMQNEINHRRGLGPMNEKDGYVAENFPNNIGSKRDEVDRNFISIADYEQWYKVALSNKDPVTLTKK